MMLVLLSALSGAVGGMGIGGGVILIPVLTGIFSLGQKEAQYINLLYFIPVAIIALVVHKRSGNLEIRKALYIALGGILGAVIGSEFAARISMYMLRKMFGIFLLIIGITGITETFHKKDKKANNKQ